MTFVVFDLDGTLAHIDHRRHYMASEPKDYRAFFAACDQDTINEPVLAALKAHIHAMHRVEIWSGRSDEVYQKTAEWLNAHGIDQTLLTHMRRAGDTTGDHILKKQWLDESDPKPDICYDDRQSIVDMYRANGIACFQVNAAEWSRPKRAIQKPGPDGNELILLVGPSGAGKSHLAMVCWPASWVISTDEIRRDLCGNLQDQSRNKEVFEAVRRIARSRLSSGLSCVIDATHLRRKTRREHVDFAPPGVPVRYMVCDRPLETKMRDGGWRNSIVVDGVSLIERHHNQFQAALKDILAGDGLPNVTVTDKRELEELVAA